MSETPERAAQLAEEAKVWEWLKDNRVELCVTLKPIEAVALAARYKICLGASERERALEEAEILIIRFFARSDHWLPSELCEAIRALKESQ
jgi:hypothetical protein